MVWHLVEYSEADDDHLTPLAVNFIADGCGTLLMPHVHEGDWRAGVECAEHEFFTLCRLNPEQHQRWRLPHSSRGFENSGCTPRRCMNAIQEMFNMVGELFTATFRRKALNDERFRLSAEETSRGHGASLQRFMMHDFGIREDLHVDVVIFRWHDVLR